MRGVLGILLIGLGLFVGYLVLSGHFPAGGPLPGTPGNEQPTPSSSPSVVNGGTSHAPGHGPVPPGSGSDAPAYKYSGFMGLGTMAFFNDLAASRGAMN